MSALGPIVWPGRSDPRWPVAGLLLGYVILGITVLGFNRTPLQVGATVLCSVVLDMLLHRLLRRGPMLFPLSAVITGLGLSILVNYAHGLLLAAVAPTFAIASKYIFTLRGRHVFNPAQFGVVACLLLGDGMISDAPSYQWGGSYAIAIFIVTLAVFLFVLRIQRVALIVSFLAFYAMALLLRAWLTRWHMPMETWLLGALSSPPLYLFTFFMITDPQTSPPTRKGQVVAALCIVLIDFGLHLLESLSTLFYAAFIYTSLRFVVAHLRALRDAPVVRRQPAVNGLATGRGFRSSRKLLFQLPKDVCCCAQRQLHATEPEFACGSGRAAPAALLTLAVRRLGQWG